MSKRNFIVLVSVLSLVLILFLAKIIFKGNLKDNGTLRYVDLKTQYEQIKKCGKPSIVIFSYDGDCCENTKRFFDEYNNKAKMLISDYENKVNGVFINTGALSEKDNDVLAKIAKENKVNNLPFILIMDKTGEIFKVIEGKFEDEEVRKIIDGMVK